MRDMLRGVADGSLIHLASCLALAVLGGCDPYVSVTSTIRDQTGSLVEGVTVALQVPSREPDMKLTRPDGRFNVSMVGAEPARTRIVFRKEGCEPSERAIPKEGVTSIDVVLDCTAR